MTTASTFTMTMPLTLTSIDALLAQVANYINAGRGENTQRYDVYIRQYDAAAGRVGLYGGVYIDNGSGNLFSTLVHWNSLAERDAGLHKLAAVMREQTSDTPLMRITQLREKLIR